MSDYRTVARSGYRERRFRNPVRCGELAAELAGFAFIHPFADGTYVPVKDGPVFAKLFPLRNRRGSLEDIVAVEFGTSSPWWLRRGGAAILGEDVLESSIERGLPAWLVATPDEWLVLNGFAVCIVDWAADLYPILSQVQWIIERQDLADRVRRMLIKRHGSMFNVRLWTYSDVGGGAKRPAAIGQVRDSLVAATSHQSRPDSLIGAGASR